MPPIATVEVPASSANLGSGFDAFAAAISLKLRGELHYGDEPGIALVVHGEGAPAPDAPADDNLVIRAFKAGLRAAGGAPGGSGSWQIEVSSMIPVARGLGSSAAAIVAGVLLGGSVGRRELDADTILRLAVQLEGHADNVAAALYGGITLSVPEAGSDAPEAPVLRRFRVPEAWIPVLFVPIAESPTEEMRAVLPVEVSHRDATVAAARAALLATAIVTSDAGLLRTAMDDRLHQPYRLPLMPGTRELIELAYARGAAGACLSGAGPSIIAICDHPASAHAVEKAFNAAAVDGIAMRLRFDTGGARLAAASQ
jgi:homoserine kinase